MTDSLLVSTIICCSSMAGSYVVENSRIMHCYRQFIFLFDIRFLIDIIRVSIIPAAKEYYNIVFGRIQQLSAGLCKAGYSILYR